MLFLFLTIYKKKLYVNLLRLTAHVNNWEKVARGNQPILLLTLLILYVALQSPFVMSCAAWYRLPIPVAPYWANTIAVVCKSPKAPWNRLYTREGGGSPNLLKGALWQILFVFALFLYFIISIARRFRFINDPYIPSTSLPRYRLRATSNKGFILGLHW